MNEISSWHIGIILGVIFIQDRLAMRKLHNSYVSVISTSYGNHKVIVVLQLEGTTNVICKNCRL